MAVPAYATDLQDIDLAEANTNWAEPTASGWTLGAAPGTADTENIIQGTYSIPKAFNATGVGGMLVNAGSGKIIPTDGAFLCWCFWASPNALDIETNGGIRLVAGNALNAFYACKSAGKDSYLYGGWMSLAFDPNQSGARDYTAGAPSGTWQYFGWVVNNLNAITKGSPFVADAIRYGRCELRVNGGEAANYATFAGMAAKNDANDGTNGYNRWGLFQEVGGTYLWKGLITLGYTSVVDFRDSNRTIIIDKNVKKVSSNFNKIEIRQVTSRVDWSSISILSLSTVSKGNLEVIDNADVNLDNCTFTDMDTFVFLSNSTILTTTFRRCGLVTQNSAIFTGARFESSPASVSILSNNPAVITNSTFISDGSNHAMELTPACAGNTYSLSGCTFTGYATANGSTGNEVIYNNSGGAVVINASGCSGSISYRNGPGATTTVNNTITLTLTGLISGSDIVILDAGTTTERVNVDNNIPTTYAYGYTDSGSYVDIGIFKAGYIPKYVRNFLLAATNASLPIEQILDRNYIP